MIKRIWVLVVDWEIVLVREIFGGFWDKLYCFVKGYFICFKYSIKACRGSLVFFVKGSVRDYFCREEG